MDKFLASLASNKFLDRCMRKLMGHYVTIYMIHRAPAQDKSHLGLSSVLLEQCLQYAQAMNYEFAYLDDLLADALNGVVPKRPTICFTLDDGFDDQARVLAPILLKYNAKPTLFVLTDFIDRIDWPWDYKLTYMVSHTDHPSGQFIYKEDTLRLDFTSAQARIQTRRNIVKYAKYLSSAEYADFYAAISRELGVNISATAPDVFTPSNWEDLRQLEALGLRIGSHACSHRVFSSLTLDEVEAELVRAKSRLAAELKSPSTLFCYPSGTANDYEHIHAHMVKQLGYLGAVSAKPANTNLPQIKKDPFNINRHSFPTRFEVFARYSSWVEAIRSRPQ